MLGQGLRLIVVYSPPLDWMHMPHHSSGTKWTCHEKSTEFLCVVIFSLALLWLIRIGFPLGCVLFEVHWHIGRLSLEGVSEQRWT